jgi:hypothetical protein
MIRNKFLQLITFLGSSVLVVMFLLIVDDSQHVAHHGHHAGDVVDGASKADDDEDTGGADSFARRRQHLESVCDKYEDVYRPEYYNLYREDVHLTNLSMFYFVAAEREFSGRR